MSHLHWLNILVNLEHLMSFFDKVGGKERIEPGSKKDWILLSFREHVYGWACLCKCLSVCCLFVCLCICVAFSLMTFICLCVCLFICLSMCVSLSACPSVYMYVCVFVCLSLIVCLYI